VASPFYMETVASPHHTERVVSPPTQTVASLLYTETVASPLDMERVASLSWTWTSLGVVALQLSASLCARQT